MGWWDRVLGRRGSTAADLAALSAQAPPPPTSAEILASVRAVESRVDGTVPLAVSARVHRISAVVDEMVPRLDRLGAGSQQAHTVVATATDYLPEAVDAYLRLPRDFADRRVVSRGKTSLMLLCDQLDLLSVTLTQISDAVSRQDAQALVVHGRFLDEKFAESSLQLPADPGSA